jgi:3',5'-cyclic AMP phosphodiesterase CpdA
MVNEQAPDLVAITGDFASYSARRLDEELLVGALRRLSARDGVISILGNHDYLTDVNLVRRLRPRGRRQGVAQRRPHPAARRGQAARRRDRRRHGGQEPP